MKWTINHLDIKGIKGILDQSGDFDFSGGGSVALYAPNGCGKSGYADAIEYLFSHDGEVGHYGKGGQDSEHGGKHAIPHVLAEEKKIESEVSITLCDIDSGNSIAVNRKVRTGRNDFLPKDLGVIINSAPAHRVLRSHDLSRFVVDMDPREKYAELSKWLGLEHLEKVLTHITTADKKLAEANHEREILERIQDISKNTNGEVTTYEETKVLDWCAKESRKYLQKEISIKSVRDLDECIATLQKKYEENTKNSTQSILLEAKTTLEKTVKDLVSKEGLLEVCNLNLANLMKVDEEIKQLTTEAKDSVFQEVWKGAQELLTAESLNECPICLTPWEDSKVKSQDGAMIHISKGLESLSDLSTARSNREIKARELRQSMKSMASELRKIESATKTLAFREEETRFASLSAEIEELSDSSYPSNDFVSKYKETIDNVTKLISKDLLTKIQSVVVQGVSDSTADMYVLTNHITTLKETMTRLAELHRLQAEYAKVRAKFSQLTTVIQKQASDLIINVVNALREDMLAIYQKIDQSGAVPDIHIEPNAQDKTIILRISFHSPSRKLPPAGYLSESRTNTIGLALFISSIRLFNKKFPFVFLDDIVSSYDADHRARIVDVIAEDLAGCQVFLTTHDDRFYQMLKSRLSKGWRFHRISGWKLDQGPRRLDDLLKPQEIDNLIDDGDPKIAGNAVRQFMEEWLDDMCAKYEVHTVHKRGQKEFDRTLYDFWEPFLTRIQSVGGDFVKRITSQSCYDRLKAHGLLNYYSHAQANPYEWQAIGDVKYIWKEFQQFQKLFNCHSCGKLLLYHHDKKRLHCTCGRTIFPQLA